MKTARAWTFAIAVLLAFAFPQVTRSQPLAGTYTIGGTSPDFPSFSAAVASLTSNGVSGPVTLNVRPGTYTERIVIPAITGASPAQAITFQSETGNPGDVSLRYTAASSSDNSVITLRGASHIRILNMLLSSAGAGAAYRNVIVLDGTPGTVSDVTIQGIQFYGYVGSSSSSDLACINGLSGLVSSDLTIARNTFITGGFGIVLAGNSGQSSTGTVIRANTFAGCYGAAYLTWQSAPAVDSNTVNVSYDGIDLNLCGGALSIQRNKVSTSSGGAGITINTCQGDNLNFGLIADNFVSILGTAGGTGLSVVNSTFQGVYYNSASITASGAGFGFTQAGGGNISVTNNVFSNTAGGYAYYVNTPAGITASDHNALYGAGMIFLARWGTADCVSLAALQAASGMDQQSVSANPDFVSATDLHSNSPWLDGGGSPIAGLTLDIDGNVRNGVTPDIGASEFTGTVTKIAGGTYTIGGVSPNYATFTAAVNDLVARGITGPVTLNARPGTYAEQVDVAPVGGASQANTITIQSETSGAVLQFAQSGGSAATNWVIRVNAASYVHVRNMTLTSNGTNAAYRKVVALSGSVDDFILQGDSLGGLASSDSSFETALMAGSNVWTRSLIVEGNRFGPAGHAIFIAGYATTADSGTVIRGNSCTGGYSGFSVANQPGARVDSNIISVVNDGIELNHCPGALSIRGNRVSTSAGGYGIALDTCTGDAQNHGRIVNNFVSIRGSAGGDGIAVQSSLHQDVDYNSVNVTAAGTGYGINQTGGSNISIQNNALSNTGGSYAYCVNTPGGITTSDHNALYGAGMIFLARWGTTDCVSLEALQAAGGMDAHSVSANPDFASDTDLHANSPWLDGGGAVIAGEAVDIDGNPRSAVAPDIGASEFTTSLTRIAEGTYTIGGASPSYATFGAAVRDLVSRGISGSVTLNVRPGTYAEQIDLWPVGGAGPLSTMTFQSETSVAALQFAQSSSNAATNWVVRLNSASHVRLKNMTLASVGQNGSYRCVLVLNGSVDDLVVQGDSLSGFGSNGGQNVALLEGTSLWTHNLRILGNRFGESSYGVYVTGYGISADSGTIVRGNTFAGSYGGVYLQSQPAAIVDSNLIDVGADGIDLNSCPASLKVMGNRVVTLAGGHGIGISNCQGDISDLGVIANNLVAIQGTLGGSGISLQNSGYQNIFFNSVNVTATGSVPGLTISGGSNISIVDNIFSNTGGYYAYSVATPSAVTASSNNDLYGAGMMFLARWGNTDCVSLAALQVAGGMDITSVSANPDFTSPTDPHVNSPWLDGSGLPVGGITVDVDGHPRSAVAPDIGASEFTSSLTKAPGGIYTIGGSSPTYATFSAASADIIARGITGPVTFNARPGTYQERIDLWPFGGASQTNTLTFQSESSGAILRFAPPPDTIGVTWVFRLNSASHVRLRNMTLVSDGSNAYYRNVIVLYGSVDDLVIQGDSLSGLGGRGGQILALIAGTSVWTRGLKVIGNRFGPGGGGVYVTGYATSADSGTLVKGNSFTGSYEGVDLYTEPGCIVDSNKMTVALSGITLSGCPGSVSMQRNQITATGGGYGVSEYNCPGDPLAHGVIANNFLSSTGPDASFGVNVSNSSYQDIYYNSVNITVSTASQALNIDAGSNINIVNNIFQNTGGGYAYSVNLATALGVSDYNDLTTTGPLFARWGSADYSTLPLLRAASTMDGHSSSKAVVYASPTDLHLGGSSVGDRTLRGTPIAAVPADIDGTIRSTTDPYMGADEGDVLLSVSTDPGTGGGGSDRAPMVFQLNQNYPNPFNPSTLIRFSVEKPGRAILVLYDVTGREVATLFDGAAEPGRYYHVSVGGANLASGVYIYRLESGTRTAIRKMVYLK